MNFELRYKLKKEHIVFNALSRLQQAQIFIIDNQKNKFDKINNFYNAMQLEIIFVYLTFIDTLFTTITSIELLQDFCIRLKLALDINKC